MQSAIMRKARLLAWNRAFKIGSPARTRTTDMVVNSHPLYRLSYWGTELLILKQSNKITKIACFVNRFFPAQSAGMGLKKQSSSIGRRPQASGGFFNKLVKHSLAERFLKLGAANHVFGPAPQPPDFSTDRNMQNSIR